MASPPPVDLTVIQQAASRLKDVLLKTELIPSPAFGKLARCKVWLKPENLQVTGSYKIRGAYNKVALLSAEQRQRGLIPASAGNHAGGVVIALSYGERGESGELWKDPDQTIENVKRIRHEEASAAAETVGATFRGLDLGDYPLTIRDSAMEQLVELFREWQPDVVLTHTPADPFNPDHPVACQAVQRARLLASGAGVSSAFRRIIPPDLYFFEPHQPELCLFNPNTFVDITHGYGAKTKGNGVHGGPKLSAELLY